MESGGAYFFNHISERLAMASRESIGAGALSASFLARQKKESVCGRESGPALSAAHRREDPHPIPVV